ncbi:MAG: enoyl-CoA hydratase/isomerase family protein, partial [Nevskiales bacterium]
AFCAGGDVRSLREAILAHQAPAPNPLAEAFFSEEYRLDYRIHTYPKPILVWGGGIVMGGGLGLLAGASHRVVTETSRIAMPEIGIGLYPDVGGSWFLRHMPGRTGLFLALTGAALNGHDALAVGLADFFLRAADRGALMERLGTVAWTDAPGANHAALSRALRQFAGNALELRPVSNVRTHAEAIERLTDGDTLAEVVSLITGYRGEDAWLGKAAATLAGGSPTSAALIWAIWQRARHMSLAEAFRMELIVSLQCCEHPDFAEGVRALLVDKDNQPRWTPATLAEVSDAWIAQHFAAPWSPWANQAHPLADL